MCFLLTLYDYCKSRVVMHQSFLMGQIQRRTQPRIGSLEDLLSLTRSRLFWRIGARESSLALTFSTSPPGMPFIWYCFFLQRKSKLYVSTTQHNKSPKTFLSPWKQTNKQERKTLFLSSWPTQGHPFLGKKKMHNWHIMATFAKNTWS